MTFEGLLDCQSDNEGDEAEENVKTDHALMFIFSSIAHAFHQTTGMFAFMGSTKFKPLINSDYTL